MKCHRRLEDARIDSRPGTGCSVQYQGETRSLKIEKGETVNLNGRDFKH
jgi:hypothetical protein